MNVLPVNLTTNVANLNLALASHVNYIKFYFLKNARFNKRQVDANLCAYVTDAIKAWEIFCLVMTKTNV